MASPPKTDWMDAFQKPIHLTLLAASRDGFERAVDDVPAGFTIAALRN
jgi:hypothetical protein